MRIILLTLLFLIIIYGVGVIFNKAYGAEITLQLTGEMNWGQRHRSNIIHILKAEPGDRITIQVSSGGGYMSVMWAYMMALNTTKACVTANVNSMAASAAYLVLYNMHKVTYEPYSLFLIHLPRNSDYTQLTGIELWAAKIFTSSYLNYLNPREVNDVMTYKDVWLTGYDFGSRFPKHPENWNVFANEQTDIKGNCNVQPI